MFDLVVLGGGLAGATAALSARAQGARVAVASRSYGATALSTGALDLAHTPALARASVTPHTIAEHVMDIIAHRPRHPYAVMGLEATLRGLGEGFATLTRAIAPFDLAPPPLNLEAENLLLPSALGALLACGSALAPHVGGDFASGLLGRWGVLSLAGLADFCAGATTRGLLHDARAQGSAVDLVEVAAPSEPALGAVDLARRLDDEAEARKLADALVGKSKGLAGLITPPVLGLDRHAAVRGHLSAALGIPVVEALASVPSVPGVRLQRALWRALAEAGVERVGEIVAVRPEGRHIEAALTRDDLAIAADAFVLATGRFIAGGVTFTDRCREALLGLPVATEEGLLEDESPHAIVRRAPMEWHPLMTAGIEVTSKLQPLREGEVAYDNLYAAGMVIGGFASRYVLCADGVALATGWHAGRAALARQS